MSLRTIRHRTQKDEPGSTSLPHLRFVAWWIWVVLAAFGFFKSDTFGAEPLAQALDNSTLAWVSGGHNQWFSQTNQSISQNSAAQSGVITNAQETWLETHVTGPGLLQFHWKVSSETNWDCLLFRCDEEERFRISGQVDWELRQTYIEEGEHVVRWAYTKDATGFKGVDAGWVDQVAFVPGKCAPIIQSLPSFKSPRFPSGSSILLNLKVEGSQPIRIQWIKDGQNLADNIRIVGANSASLTITNLAVSDSGWYSLRAINAQGATASEQLLLTVYQTVPLPDVFDANDLPWDSSGNAAWFGQPVDSISGMSAQSGNLKDSQESWLETQITGPGLLSFQWKVSSENGFDFLRLDMDGATLMKISGEVAWNERSITVPNGLHKFRWTYRKDDADFNSIGADAGWLDEVSFTRQLVPKILQQPQPVIAKAGESAVLKVEALGEAPLSCQWLYCPNLYDPPMALSSTNSDSLQLVLTNLHSANAGYYSLKISNSHGRVVSSQALVIVTIPLSEAFTNSTFKWATGSTVPWVGVGGAFDGAEGAARSGIIGDNRETWLETSATGPGILSFHWKVSSEPNCDFLGLLVDGTEIANITGEADWNVQKFFLSAGSHKVRWRYKKDQNQSQGLDAAWINQVTFKAGESAPFIITQTKDIDLPEGASARLECITDGSSPMSFQWLKNGVIQPASKSILVLTNLQLSDSGGYLMVASNFIGSVTSQPIRLRVFATTPIPQALNTSGFSFTTGGDASWFGQTNVSFDGLAAAQSGLIADQQTSWLQTQLLGPGVVSFRWKVSSETNYDFLLATLDGLEQFRISGESGWEYHAISIPTGLHTVKWIYSKDDLTSAGSDHGWIDTVAFESPMDYAQWLAKSFTTNEQNQAGISGPLADPDQDGRCNLLEFLVNTDPKRADASEMLRVWLSKDEIDGSLHRFFSLVRRKALRGVVIEIQNSTDLKDWSACTMAEIGSIDHENGAETVIYRDDNPMDSRTRFLRLMIK